MNIFVLDRSPQDAARFLCDAHVVKMIVESAQLLSAHDRLNGTDHGYKITHENHPCRKSLENPANYRWLCSHLRALLAEYTFRYGKIHSTQVLFLNCWNHCRFVHLPEDGPLLTLPECMPDEFKSGGNGIRGVVESYRNYYRRKQKTLPRFRYTGRAFPDWLDTDAGLIRS